MSTKIKLNGVWQDISLSSQVGIADALLKTENWAEDINTGSFKFLVNIPGMTESYSAIVLFDANQDGLEITAACVKDGVQFSSNQRPSNNLNGDIIYTSKGATATIYYIGGLTDNGVAAVIDQVIKQLPITVDENGYTSLENVRQMTYAKFTRNGQDITINYTLEGNVTMQDQIHLNENNYPVSGVSNGVAWTMDWEGF